MRTDAPATLMVDSCTILPAACGPPSLPPFPVPTQHLWIIAADTALLVNPLGEAFSCQHEVLIVKLAKALRQQPWAASGCRDLHGVVITRCMPPYVRKTWTFIFFLPTPLLVGLCVAGAWTTATPTKLSQGSFRNSHSPFAQTHPTGMPISPFQAQHPANFSLGPDSPSQMSIPAGADSPSQSGNGVEAGRCSVTYC